MSQHIRMRIRQGPRQAVPGLVLGAGALLVFARTVAPLRAGQSDAPAQGNATAAQAPQNTLPAPAATPLFVRVNIDTTQTSASDLIALRAALEGAANPGPLPADLDTTARAGETVAGVPDWLVWGRFTARRAATYLYLPTSLPASAVGVYAVRAAAGASVCVVNRAGQTARVRLRVRLPRGLYRVERLLFAPPPPSAPAQTVSETPSPQAASAATQSAESALPGARLDRLGGCDLSAQAVLTKWVLLAPGQVCLYRCTDEAQAARRALYETRARLHPLAASAPGTARRIRRILSEGEPYLSGLTVGVRRRGGLSKRLGCIHRLLLLAAQAQAIQHNDRLRGGAPAEVEGAVTEGLERLSDSLSEASAALLGLAPNVTLAPSITTPPAQTSVAEPQSAVASAQEATGLQEMIVTVALTNAGGQSVPMVKLGLDPAALPAGVSCRPTDPAFFGTLYPGQTVRATFHLRCPAQTPLAGSRCVGEVSYFMGGAPAHLRLRSW